MKIIIDRFEGPYAIVEIDNGDFMNMPKALLPNMANEGDVISIEIDEEATERRRERIKHLLE